jgi:hypothetical protein
MQSTKAKAEALGRKAKVCLSGTWLLVAITANQPAPLSLRSHTRSFLSRHPTDPLGPSP